MPVLRTPRRPLLRLLTVFALAIALAGCSHHHDSVIPKDCTKVSGDTYTLVANDLAWNTSCIEVKVGTTVHFTVKLEDAGVQHNLEISGQGQKKQQTQLQAGPATQHLTFTFPLAGAYSFECTIHSTMTGTIWAQ